MLPPPLPHPQGDLSDILRLDLTTAGQFLAFKDFESGGALDSALALVEHLMVGCLGSCGPL